MKEYDGGKSLKNHLIKQAIMIMTTKYFITVFVKREVWRIANHILTIGYEALGTLYYAMYFVQDPKRNSYDANPKMDAKKINLAYYEKIRLNKTTYLL